MNMLKSPASVSLLFVGALVLGVLLALTPRYETNDDVGMNAIAAGRILVDRPDEHLVFSNVLIGLCLKPLYQIFPAFPWYGAYLFTTAALSLAAICFACLRQDLSEWRLGLVALFLWVAGIPSLTLLQFTRVAFLASLAGLLLLAGAVRAQTSGWQKWCSIPFLVAGSLIRFESLQLACVVLSPVVAWMLWRARRQKSARGSLLLLFACLVVGFGAARFNAWYYARDPAWRDFLRFNRLRVEFIDWNRVAYNRQTAPVFESIGWLPIDLKMLKSWATLDRERFSSEKLETILKDAGSRSQPPTKPWGLLLAALFANGELWALWACGAACFAILTVERSARFIPSACYCVTIATCLLVYQRLHLPPRVYCPAFSACAITAILFSDVPRSFGRRPAWVESPWGRRVALALVGALVAWRGAATFRSNANFLSLHRQADRILTELAPKADQLYVVWGGDFPYESVVLPLVPASIPHDFKVMNVDGATGFAESRMSEFDIRDWMSIVKRGDGTYLVCQKFEREILSDYVRVRYRVDLDFQVVFAHPGLYDAAVYRVGIAQAMPGTRSPGAKSSL